MLMPAAEASNGVITTVGIMAGVIMVGVTVGVITAGAIMAGAAAGGDRAGAGVDIGVPLS